MKKLQPVLPVLAITAGLVTLLASSLTDEEEQTPPVPVTVEYALQTTGTGLGRKLETREGIATDLQLTGSYEANSGDGLTLDRSIVNLDATGSFMLEIVPSGDELLTGSAAFEIDSSIDFGLDRVPGGGRFTSTMDGTDTVVNITSAGVDIAVGGADPFSLNWSDFVAREDDADADLDERMASAAYNMLSAVLRAALLVEDIASDIEANRDMLESMGVTERLELSCNNLSSDQGDDPRRQLTWTEDANSNGELGIGDSFEAFYRNCRNQRSRYVDGTVLLSDYVPDRGEGLRTLDVRAELRGNRGLFNSETVVDVDTEASAASPLYNGFLTLTYQELPRSTP